MKKLKLMTILGTRPEIIKLSEIIKKSELYFDHYLVHTGQNYDYELNEIFFKEFHIKKPDFFLDVVRGSLGETLGNIIHKSYEIMKEVKPDALLVLGDTNSCLSVISAKRLKIPIFHLEAGNRCFDENLPEEINRKIIDHISDVNLCYSDHAKDYLRSEGLPMERTFVVGSPIPEVIKANADLIFKSQIMETLNILSKKYILLSCHREENIDNEENFFSLMNSINLLAEIYNVPVIYSIHPRSKKYIKLRKFKFHPNVKEMLPFSFSDYICLQKNSLCVVSDSGTLAEEASYFKFPAVSIRTSTERPEAFDKGNLIIGNITSDQILQSVDLAINLDISNNSGSDVSFYLESNISTKVIKLIQSYVSIVNKVVWKKN